MTTFSVFHFPSTLLGISFLLQKRFCKSTIPQHCVELPTLAGAFPEAPDNYRPEYFPLKGAIKKIVRRDVGDYVPGEYSGPARRPEGVQPILYLSKES
jgi:hypothetical protein